MPFRRPAISLLLFLLGCAVFVWAQRSNYERPVRQAARGTRAAVAAGSDYATDSGMRMYYKGGNAVDAGVTAMFAAATTEYSHFGYGGEAPILIRTRDGKIHAIAGVGTMPKLATAEFFRNRPLQTGELTSEPEKGGLKGMVPVAGLMPALVPGMVEAGLVALREYGTKSFNEAIEPAIELADGSAIDEMRSGTIDRCRPFFDLWPSSKAHFLPNGQVPYPGQIFRQPDLARTLRGMAEAERKALAAGGSRTAGIDAVRDYFYRGEIARKIGAFVEKNHGLLRYEDMAAFRLQPEDAVSTNYRGYQVYKPGFWSQGPAMIEALNILSGYNLAAMKFNSTEYIHTLVEALKLAYADRDTYYGDPKFNKIPAETLLSMRYADERRKLIGPNASLDFRPGKIGDHPPVHPSLSEVTHFKIDDMLMARDTTCVDAIDKSGMMFSATPSGAWLPSVIAGDTGIPLTERAQSFLLVPGHPNELAGGKRPRVTLSPTIVTRDGQPSMAFSTPGGDNQEQSLIQVFLDVVEFGMGTEAAIEAPRIQTRHLVSSFDNHAMNPGDLLLDERISPATMGELMKREHRVGTRARFSSGAAPVLIRITPGGVFEAGADPWGVPFRARLVNATLGANYSLFEEPSTFNREALATRLRDLAARNIFIGGSSWKYEGWLGQIYSQSRYTTRGRFSKRLFEDTCISEYAETFPTVCGDFAFYQFPTEEFWKRLFNKVPEKFQFGFKIPEQITCRVFPLHDRYGATAGHDNPAFLDAGLLMDGFLRPLEPYRSKTGVLIFEFGAFSRRAMSGVDEFVERLDAFLEALPREFRYSVEIRNPEFLTPAYFSCLSRHHVAAVYNAWTKMPELPAQIAIPESRTADFMVCRALLKRGRAYEDAVKKFTPYAEVQEVHEPARQGLRELIHIAREERRITFIFVNNRLEGNSPGTIVSITDPDADV